ncbi:MAG: lipoprotein insertase outer membrane protein LolB [Gammaproteobacteria bacterium]
MRAVASQKQGWWLLLVILGAGLGGCQTVPQSGSELGWPDREKLLRRQTSFETTGRLSLTVPSTTNQASFALSVDKRDLGLKLSGPFGIGAIRLEVTDGKGRLISAKHGNIALDNTEEDLLELLGYPVPLNAIRYWALGLPQPKVPSERTYSDDWRLLKTLDQQGWKVKFESYRAVALDPDKPDVQIELPRKVRLEGPDVSILMVFRHWRF